MFEQFSRLVEKWIQKQGFGPQIAALTPKPRPPRLTDQFLWRAFLPEALPEAGRACLCLPQNPLGPWQTELEQLNEFTTQPQIKALISKSPLGFLEPEDQELLQIRLLRFQERINQWHRGDYHRQIAEDPFDTLFGLYQDLRLDEPWAAARFLSRIGYGFPHSQGAYRAFRRFDGTESESYQGWFDKLTDQASLEEAYQLDRRWDLIFGPLAPLSLPSVCMDSPLCPSCFLQSGCRFFKERYLTDTRLALENRLRLGQGAEIDARELVLYLAQERWHNGVIQNRWIQGFAIGRLEALPILEKIGPQEEEFILFARALEEAGFRIANMEREKPGQVITNSQGIFEHYRFRLGREKQESFHILILDNKYQQIGLKMISMGLLDQTLVHPREVFAPAIQLRAAAIILIHNHPSGDVQPSHQDLAITDRLSKAGQLIGIAVLDHVILSEERYFSFVDENLLPG